MTMLNQAMRRALDSGECVDVSKCERNEEGDYIITDAVWAKHTESPAGMNFCDSEEEEWIRSIGLRREDGVRLASTSNKFYRHEDFECLWLR